MSFTGEVEVEVKRGDRVESCYLCNKKIETTTSNELITVTLYRNFQWNKLSFHCDCFFSAAGKEYKTALRYDELGFKKAIEPDPFEPRMMKK